MPAGDVGWSWGAESSLWAALPTESQSPYPGAWGCWRVVKCRWTDPQEAPPGQVQHKWGGRTRGQGREGGRPRMRASLGLRTVFLQAPRLVALETLSSAWGPACTLSRAQSRVRWP